MVLAGIGLFILLLMTYLLFAPLVIEIDSSNDLYRISMVPIVRFRWLPTPFPGSGELSIIGIKKQISFSGKAKKVAEKKEEKKNAKVKQLSARRMPNIQAIAKSFKVETCYVNVDTGDMPLNGLLFPCFEYLSNKSNHHFHINFIGKTEVVFRLRNNLFRLLIAFTKKSN